LDCRTRHQDRPAWPSRNGSRSTLGLILAGERGVPLRWTRIVQPHPNNLTRQRC
jgi:hypothetical protein